MGDFTGFTFGNWHSSDPQVGDIVVRVSGGDRYEEQLHPEVKDITAEVPGRDGEYYFGSNYGPKTIDIEIAFDHLTEEQFRKLRQVFGTRKIKELIFDERPYKKYMAKIESPIELSYICFDEPKRHIDTSGNARGVRWVEETHTEAVIDEETGEPTDETVEVTERVRETIYPYVKDEGTERIYKGEGKISFICYFPFAKSVYKQIPNGEEESDWAISSGILTAAEYEANNIDEYDSETNTINIYNPGDMDVGFRLYLPKQVAQSGISLSYKADGIHETVSLIINPITFKNNSEIGVLIDTTNEIIAGVSQVTIDSIFTTSGNIYNEYINAGYFFKFEPNFDKEVFSILETSGGDNIEIFYDYLYL